MRGSLLALNRHGVHSGARWSGNDRPNRLRNMAAMAADAMQGRAVGSASGIDGRVRLKQGHVLFRSGSALLAFFGPRIISPCGARMGCITVFAGRWQWKL